MNKKPNEPNPQLLRTTAEARLASTPALVAPARSAEELLHELRVYQIELEMQNEQLRQAQIALEKSHDRYVDLFEFAPVGYLTLTDSCLIAEANLTGAKLLRVERNKLLHRRFDSFVAPEERDRWHRFFMSVKQYSGSAELELVLQCGDASTFHAHIDCLRMNTGDASPLIRITLTDIPERKLVEEEIRNLAFYDTLTKLPNRRLFLDRFRTALPVSARRNSYGALLFLDLDKFKPLNDTFGHDYGDLMLIEVAARIKTCVREIDTAARIGGDEFVVLIEDVSNDQDEASHKAGLVAEKIREALARPYELNGHEHHSSPSIGVCLYRGNQEPVEVLLQHADMAMYQAKNAGGNTVHFFDMVMQQNVAMRAELLSDLSHAIARQQLHLHYQIQMDNGNRPVGAEALLRWFHPQRGMVMPDEFLPVAEEGALILDINDWVLEMACRQLALWNENEKMRDLTLTVNISTKQFTLPDFVDKVANALRTHQINPARLKLELTESMVLNDLAGAVKKMHALKALGIRLSMDDFGTRYSSLSYLKRLPIDQLKIDQSFVQAITRDGDDALLVGNIINLANDFRLNVIAEGVETDAQLILLKDRDCIAYQGFLFSRAVPIEEFEALMGELPQSRTKLS